MQEQLKQSGLEIKDIDGVIGVTKSIFGLEWLEDLAAKRKDMPNPLSQHPIIIGSASGSFQYLVELVELCTYLTSFRDDKELSKIIPALKEEPSYEDNLFQLAMAYRFRKLGFGIALEPPILNGHLADFSAHMGDLKIMAECTVLREWGVREEQRDVFADCLQQLKKIHDRANKRFILDIISKKSLSFKSFQPLREHIIKTGTEFLKTGNPTKISDEAYDVSVYEMDIETSQKVDANSRAFFRELGDKGWDQILSFDIATTAIPGDVTSIDFNRISSRSIMRHKSLVSPEEEFEYSLEDKLDKKSGGKLKQLKSHPQDHLSLLFIEVEDKLENADFDRIGKRLSNNVFRKAPSLNGVFIAKRHFTGRLTHQYQGTFFSNPAIPFNDNLFLGFNMVERDLDFVKEWQAMFK